MRSRLCCFLWLLVCPTAYAADLERVRALVKEGRLSAASALVSAEMALEPAADNRERLRLYLLKALLEGERGRPARAREWLDLASAHWRGALGSDASFGSEVELVRHDLEIAERRGR